jgi:hypothetical protein
MSEVQPARQVAELLAAPFAAASTAEDRKNAVKGITAPLLMTTAFSNQKHATALKNTFSRRGARALGKQGCRGCVDLRLAIRF